MAAADSNKSSSSSTILFKSRSWSPEIHRQIEWETLKMNQRRRRFRRSKSLDSVSDFDVTDDDIKELRACFELGFGFDSTNESDPKLASAFPALELYKDVNRQFIINNQNLSRSSSIDSDSSSSSSSSSNSDSSSNLIVNPKDDPQKVKMRLKLWALVVACSIREASTQSATEVMTTA